MGLDSVEIIFAVEEHFGISISDAEAAQILRVADLVDCVALRLQELARQGKLYGGWTEEQILDTIRDIIVDEVGVSRERITLEAQLHADLRID